MKAEERKEIEQNSLIHLIQKGRESLSGRGLYYVVGTIALVVAAILLWNYFSRESRLARDAKFLQLERADTPDKLKQGIEEHRGTVVGSLFKLHLARHLLYNEGLPKLGTDREDTRRQSASAVAQARDYFRELTGEFKEHKEEGLTQQAWIGAAEAEEALVGLPKTAGGTDDQGDADKAIEYYANAGKIFPDTEFSKKYAKRAETLRETKTQFIATQREIYKLPERPNFDPKAKDPGAVPPPPEPAKVKEPDPKAPPTKTEPTPEPAKIKEPDAKKPDEPKKVDEPKKTDPKPADPKAK
jgi:hypothetical protein